MKKFTTIYLIILLLGFTSYKISAQQIGPLDGINYQAVAVDDEGKEIVGMDVQGKPLYEKEIGVRFTIQKGEDGPVLYQENHTTLTDRYGLFSLIIGKGEQTGNGQYSDLLNIPWIDADQWLKVEIALKNDGNYRIVSLQKFMTVPYSFYTDDIADNAITTSKILDETIQAEDIGTGAVTSDEILDETIAASDIGTGAVTSDEILDQTIATNDLSTGAVTSEKILDGTIQNNDIADSSINLSTKVTDTLSVKHGGTGAPFLEPGGILIGGGSGAVRALPAGTNGQIPVGVTSSAPVMKALVGGAGIQVIQKADSVVINSTITGGGVSSNSNTSVNPGNIQSGTRWLSPSFVLQQPANLPPVAMGDLLIASADVDMQGCLMSVYLESVNNGTAHARVAIFNPGNSSVNLGNGVNIKILVVK